MRKLNFYGPEEQVSSRFSGRRAFLINEMARFSGKRIGNPVRGFHSQVAPALLHSEQRVNQGIPMEDTAPDKTGIRVPPLEARGEAQIAEPADQVSGNPRDDSEEVDVWYGSYAGRAMLPRFMQLALLSGLIIAVAWSLGAWRGSNVVRYTALAIIVALWLALALVWIKRFLGLNYRLTTKRLFYQFGFHHPGRPGTELRRIRQVAVEANRIERLLDVGRLRIFLDQGAPLILEGVQHPFHVAKQIERRRRL
jgi:hypothetical protein